MDDRSQLAGAVGQRATDSAEATSTWAVLLLEAGDAQGVSGGVGRVLVEVSEQDGFADADAAGDRLADGAGADDDDDLVGGGDGHGMPLSQWFKLRGFDVVR